MFPCPSARRALLALTSLLLPSVAACQDALLDVSGRVLATEPRLEVLVTLTNRGRAPAGSIEVRGELFGERQEALVPQALGPGAEGEVTLDFPQAASRPGLHALTLLLEYPVEGPPDGAGNPQMASQVAFLLLALGADPGPAVRLEADPLTLDVRGSVNVRIESRDAEPQRVRLRALTPRGLRPEGGLIEVAVPAHGHAAARLGVARAGVPRGRQQALLLVAENLDGPLARTTVAAVSVELLADPARLPDLRAGLVVGGVALLLAALGYELWIRLRPGTAPTA